MAEKYISKKGRAWAAMNITKKTFGTISTGEEAVLYTITNEAGCKVELTNFGASVVSLWVPNKNGELTDVALGCANAADYEKQTACLGAVPGRHANRIGKGVFTLGGREYQLAVNNGSNHLHGGNRGFDHRLWNHTATQEGVIFSYLSPNGEEGYPGTLLVSVAYSLDEENQLNIEYNALCDQDTVINLTNHTYFNLNGHHSGTILDHRLCIHSGAFTENDPECLPTGSILPVEGTPMDFRQPKAIGRDINQEDVQLKNGSGYDHNYVLGNLEGAFILAAEVLGPKTSITMNVYTTQPGMQLYTANFIHTCNVTPKDGGSYEKNSGLCLETQHYPNAMAHTNFPRVVLRAGELYHHITAYGFGVEKGL